MRADDGEKDQRQNAEIGAEKSERQTGNEKREPERERQGVREAAMTPEGSVRVAGEHIQVGDDGQDRAQRPMKPGTPLGPIQRCDCQADNRVSIGCGHNGIVSDLALLSQMLPPLTEPRPQAKID